MSCDSNRPQPSKGEPTVSTVTTSLRSIGKIASALGVPIHRVEYILASRDITPVAMIGHARAFDDHQVDEIAAELRRADAYRERRGR
jgi:hypothetical protein